MKTAAGLSPSVVFDALVELFTERLAERLADREREAPTHYTTSKQGPHAPGKSRRWCLDNLRHIPGARRVGRDWVVAVRDFDAWSATRTPGRVSNVVPLKGERWSAEGALLEAGVRPVVRKGGDR
jgi:hypothetical protein